LRGQTGLEDRASNVVGTVDNRLFRFREATIGDPLESTPAFNGIPKAIYTDPNYGAATVPGTFAFDQANRDGTVYVGTNDGMLHAFDSDNGVERWAYVPKMVMPNMWKLADKNYANLHTNYVNGDPVINDVCTANCNTGSATWKTILVGGLNGGGTGYYALDVTDPENPISLWEFDTTDDADLGYTFGNPIITKKSNGDWVVLVTSGYNNVSGSVSTQGKGFLYVLDVKADITKPGRAKVLTKYNTGEGSATTPSGLAKIRAFITDAQKNNAALNIYGGDLLGNLWRFDINSSPSTSNPFKLAKLLGPSSVEQPITVKPELSEVDGKRIIFVGTGKYLEANDLTNTATQTLYAITDANETVTLNNPRGSTDMVNQTISNSGATRLVTNNPVSYATKRGWYIDLPDSGERQNVPSQVVLGTLLVPTIVPSNTVCSPGGYGWLNFLNFKTGAIIAQSIVGSKTNAPIVGINVLYVNGKPKVSIVTTDNPTPEPPAEEPEFSSTTSGFQDRRVIWRELIEEQQ
jgi:type IV pilus assembly protein PilY1